MCRRRGIDFVDVDLRWGITEEEARDVGVLPICLREIDRCRPYFIGILGDRYGWIPDRSLVGSSDNNVEQLYPWLQGVLEEAPSITEIEMRYGALDLSPTTNTDTAFFYFLGTTTPEIGTNRESNDARARLDRLKSMIAQSGATVREQCASITSLGELVRADLTHLIEHISPKESVPSELDEIKGYHRAFATARRHAYVPAPFAIARLDAFAHDGDGQTQPVATPLVVIAPSGYGKSALLSHWSSTWNARHLDAHVIDHYVGVASGDAGSIVRHLMLEIRERFSPASEVPNDPEQLLAAFPNWLELVDKPTVIIIDAINQLTGTSRELTWLPTVPPKNVRLIVSTTPGDTSKRLRDREWQVLELGPLDQKQREAIIKSFLDEYGKSLPQPLVRWIADKDECSNALFLRTVIEELRVWGDHDNLKKRLHFYLEATNIADLFQRVLNRLETDYGAALVTAVLSLIASSRNGLSEVEVRDIAKASGIAIARLMAGIDYHLMNRGGLLTFFHDYLRQAVLIRYLTQAGNDTSGHRTIAQWFEAAPYDTRRRDEQPWQLEQIGDREALADCLTALPMFRLFAPVEYRYELIGYWNTMGQPADLFVRYSRSIDALEQTPDSTAIVLETLHSLGHVYIAAAQYEAAESLFRRASRKATDAYGDAHPQSTLAQDDLGTALTHMGKYAEAEAIFREVVETTRHRSPESQVLCTSLDNLATVLYEQGKYQEMEHVCRAALELSRRLWGPDHLQTADRIENMAGAVNSMGNTTEALKYMQDVVTIRRRVLGEMHPSTCASLINLGAMFHWCRRYDESESSYRLALRGYESFTDGHPKIADILTRLGYLGIERSRWGEAETLFLRAIDIRRRMLGESHIETVASYLALGLVRFRQGRVEEAERLFTRNFPIRLERLGPGHRRTKDAAANYIEVLRAVGKHVEADALQHSVLGSM